MDVDTSNDEALARAIADEETDRIRRRNNNGLRYEGTTAIVPGRTVDRNPNRASNHQQRMAPPQAIPSSSHMCYAPCIIGGSEVCVELLVDTGASMSVMSWPLAQQLGLSAQLNRRYQGVANGVGQAQIMGQIKGVPVKLGHVEFPMDFAVLDMAESLLLLGLDQMRKYKCIVDLEDDVLVFGGKGGVEVKLLPADDRHQRAFRQAMEGCSVM